MGVRLLKKPRFVALCGAPHAGKTEVARILIERYGAGLIDDGEPLRKAVSALYGALGVLPDDCYTQEGKDKIIETVNDRGLVQKWTVRQLLGDLGNMLEGKYGQQIIPQIAVASVKHASSWGHVPFFVAPSVRKLQGLTWRANDGIVVEIDRPGCVPINDFDLYDRSFVDFTICNHGSIDDLERVVATTFDRFFKGMRRETV